jgi:integrase
MSIYKRNKTWTIDYYVNGQRKSEGGFSRKADAVAMHAQRLTEILAGKYPTLKKGSIRFEELAKRYIVEYSRIQKTAKSYKTDISLARSLLGFFSGLDLQEISIELIDRYKSERMQAPCVRGGFISKTTINREIGLLRNMLNHAVDWKLIGFNPILRIKFFKEEPRERILPRELLHKLVEKAGSPLREIVLTAINTGMRKGEILGLKWEHIDLSEAKLTVMKSKTNKIRVIPLNQAMMNMFNKMKENRILRGFVFINPSTGSAITDFKRSWGSLKRACDIEDFRFHDLRHCFGTYAISHNAGSLFDLKDIMGHTKIATTSRYVKSMLEGKRKMVDAFQIEYPGIDDDASDVKEHVNIYRVARL